VIRPAFRRVALRALALAAALPVALPAQTPARPRLAAPAPEPAARLAAGQALRFDTTAFGALRWREVGPPRGGRSVAAAGSVQRPLEYWMGTTGGGVWKTTDGGMSWQPASDRYFGGTIGAIAVDPSNPDVVYAGGGETDIRGNTSHGDGLWKTTDAGRTWTMLGFKEEYISTIRVHPRDPNVVYLGVFGRVFSAHPERGVYKSTDGGKSFRKVLFVSDSAGAIDLAMDPSNPDVLYAAMWQAYRTPWKMSSGGVHSGIHKSTDGGATWTKLTGTARGLPTGVIGKIGLAVSPAKPSRIWAQIEHDSGGVYRSDDGGQSWEYINRDRKLRQRAWYYSQLTADPRDSNVVYGSNVGFFRSRDGGRTFNETIATPHSDNHDLWIAPNDPNRMVQANDGGANVSFNRGASWTAQNFSTAQFYHVSTTNEFPYKVCGAQQDNSTLCGPSRKEGGTSMADWYDAGGGESGYVTPHPTKPDVIFAGSYGGLLTRKDRRTEFERNVTVHPDNPMGYSSEDIAVRFQWTFPIVFSRHDPNVLYAGGNFLFRSTDEGQSWTKVSPDLSRRDPMTMGPSGGPITRDQTGVETYGVIFTFDESPLQKGLLWAGTDDGYVWISRDNGANWKNVTPRDMGDFTRVSMIDPSRHNACTAYVASNRYQQDDKQPIIHKTADCGQTWTRIVNGIAPEEFTRVVREDPVRRGLLYAGTERGVWVSFDDGANWQSLRRNLPPVPVHDLVVKDADLVIATHGRSFWIMDDVSPLRQLAPTTIAKTTLYAPRDAYRVNWGGGGFGRGGGNSAPSGVTLYYHLTQPNQRVRMEFLDAAGKVIQSFTSDQDSATMADSLRGVQRRTQRIDSLVGAGISRDSATKLAMRNEGGATGGAGGGAVDFEALARSGPRPPRVPNRAGLNQFSWNLRYPDAVRFENMIMWAGNTNGPIAPPGTYRVRMTVEGEAQPHVQSFAVRKDPRSEATLADLQEQFRFLTQIRDRVSDANNAVRTVRNVRGQVADRTKQIAGKAQEAEFKQASAALMAELSAPEEAIYQVRNQSSQDPLNYPIKLNNKIAALTGVVASTEAKPTKQSYTVFNTLSGALEVELQKVKRSLDTTLPRVNALLRAAGLPAIVPSTAESREAARPAPVMDEEEMNAGTTKW
jgi:photosystem II stability/assembly factor-like uncharacterized protein